ncbi:MAG: DNA mismatch repair protein MutL [Nitrosomonadaceae bacterium]|nr:DNA mismatch repair protein MutL [Nitrosomonadaceae bacterium]
MEDFEIAAPAPAALIEAFRGLGYSLPTAIADLIDNSISAHAQKIEINFHWAGKDSHISILDDGQGMSKSVLFEAMRPGSKSPLDTRASHDLGRFGLGLKTASFSQCREFCVVSKPDGGSPSAYTWNLDYVCRHKEWRLLNSPSSSANASLDQVSNRPSGTAVIWSALDRVVGDSSAQDPAAHPHFNDAIDHVRQHLSLTFHRFLEEDRLRILINGSEVVPWNPFMEAHPSISSWPKETICDGKHAVEFKGYVLPHKDKMSIQEWEYNAGPLGWTGQQGFYVYRNKRLILQADWLRLGSPNRWTREKQYELARIRLDINNNTDGAWHLDVKKSTASPPVGLRPRLIDLAAFIRAEARRVFAHRGQYGPRPQGAGELERPWAPRLRSGRHTYSINRKHPLVQGVILRCQTEQAYIESLLRLLEETVPVQQIWLDTAEQVQDQAIPYDGVDYANLRADMRQVYELLVESKINPVTARQRIQSMEPFNRYPDLIREL